MLTLIQQLKNNQAVAVLLPTYYTLILVSNIVVILYFLNFYRHIAQHEKKEKIVNVCFFINKILCIYISLFHGGYNQDFPFLSRFNPFIHHPFIAIPRFLTFYLTASQLLFRTLENTSYKCLNVLLYQNFYTCFFQGYLYSMSNIIIHLFPRIEHAFISFQIASKNVPVCLNIDVIFADAV